MAPLAVVALFVVLNYLAGAEPAAPYPVYALDLGDKDASLAEVRAVMPESWKPVDPTRLSYLAMSMRTVWLHVRIPASPSAERLVAEIRAVFLRQVDFYLLDGSTLLDSSLQGMDRPYQNRPYHFIYDTFGFNASRETTRDLYIRASSDILVYLPLQIQSEASFLPHQARHTIPLAYLCGILCGIVLYNLFIFTSLPDRASFYYLAHQVCVLAIGVLVTGQMFPFMPYLAEHYEFTIRAITVALTFCAVFLTLFIQEFVALRKINPKLNRWIPWLVLAHLVIGIPSDLLSPVSYAVWGLVAAVMLGGIPAAVLQAIHRRTRNELYVNAALIGLATCGVIYLTSLTGFIPTSRFVPFVMCIGGIWEGLLLSLAITNRIRTMQDERRQLIETLKSETPTSGLNSLLGEAYERRLAPTEINVTIMFIDIVSFSLVAKMLEAREALDLLARMMQEITNVIGDCGGTIDRSLGDGILCFFGYESRLSLHSHTQDAFDAATSIQRRILWAAKQQEMGDFLLPVRIGIHVDQVLIGDLGGRERFDFTMIGNGVNFASRLETACSPFKVMLSEAAMAQLSKRSSRAEGFSEILVAVKHQENLVKAYEYNPFVEDPEGLLAAERRFCEQLNLSPQEARYKVSEKAKIQLEASVGTFRVLDFSANGFRAVSDTYVGQKVSILVHLATHDASLTQELAAAFLSSFYVEVRWSRATMHGYEHGLRLSGLSPRQKNYLLARLLSLFSSSELETMEEEFKIAS